uniref:Outer-membrane lipoprotein carrier protein n=1 Tax=Candidatus Kentrum sp. TUN TaxID=2126343 RepID=A0A450ZHD4_9GAMM|nr:MAG: outer membrane lipoprotein carrier protein [Candidatus Kentron sp. TUN]VFK53222.1 MAG: outer membrane lipoprotein carrier protein [Candidatus Kentron sp. TUN]
MRRIRPTPFQSRCEALTYSSGAKQQIRIIRRAFFCLLGFLLLGGQWPAMVSAATANDPSASKRLYEFFKEVDTLSASFKQTLFDEKGQSLEDSGGVMYLVRPKQFHWAYREPYRQTIIADGDRVWFYDEELSQVIVKPWDSFPPDTPAALLTTGQSLEDAFTIEDLGAIETRTRKWVKLTPKSPDATFVAIRLSFGKDSIEIMELSDSFGQVTRLVFSKVVTNTTLDSGLFSFTPPEGVDVVAADGEDAK